MIKLQLMKNSEDRKKINKSPAKIGGALSCTLKDDTSIFRPVLIVSKSTLGSDWANANYAYVEEFGGRYYFIENAEAMTGGRMAFYMTVDVLKTYAAAIMGTPFMIARSEDVNSSYFVDAEKVIQSKKLVYYKKLGNIPQSSTGNKFTITVAGGQ